MTAEYHLHLYRGFLAQDWDDGWDADALTAEAGPAHGEMPQGFLPELQTLENRLCLMLPKQHLPPGIHFHCSAWQRVQTQPQIARIHSDICFGSASPPGQCSTKAPTTQLCSDPCPVGNVPKHQQPQDSHLMFT